MINKWFDVIVFVIMLFCVVGMVYVYMVNERNLEILEELNDDYLELESMYHEMKMQRDELMDMYWIESNQKMMEGKE